MLVYPSLFFLVAFTAYRFRRLLAQWVQAHLTIDALDLSGLGIIMSALLAAYGIVWPPLGRFWRKQASRLAKIDSLPDLIKAVRRLEIHMCYVKDKARCLPPWTALRTHSKTEEELDK